MKYFFLTIALFAQILSGSSLTSINVSLNGAVDQSAAITPGSAQVMLAAWLVNAPNTEALRLNSVSVNLSATGTVSVINLRLLDETGAYLGQTVVYPGVSTEFFANYVLPPNAMRELRLYADIPFGEVGTLQANIEAGDILGIGTSSLLQYFGPSNELEGGIHPVSVEGGGGSGGGPGAVPEPSTSAMFAISFFSLGSLLWLRRRQTTLTKN